MSVGSALATSLTPEVVQHFGALHGYEKVLVGLLAFGPFAVMGLVVYVVRRRDLEEERQAADAEDTGNDGAYAGEPATEPTLGPGEDRAGGE